MDRDDGNRAAHQGRCRIVTNENQRKQRADVLAKKKKDEEEEEGGDKAAEKLAGAA